jgi:CHAD domain-containing protein
MLLRDASIWIEKKNTSPAGSKPSSEEQTCSLATYSARQLDRWHKKIHKQGQTVEDMNASQRHRLRIKSKRLRYALEIFGQLLPNKSLPEVKELLKRLRKIQKCLGQLNDAEQGRAIAYTLKESEQSSKEDVTGWHSLFPIGRKVEERAIKTAVLAFREMAGQKLC